MGRGHDQELDMDMEYDSPPTSLMEAMARAGIKISLGSSSTSTSTAVYDKTNVNVGPAASTMKSALRNGKSSIARYLQYVYRYLKGMIRQVLQYDSRLESMHRYLKV